MRFLESLLVVFACALAAMAQYTPGAPLVPRARPDGRAALVYPRATGSIQKLKLATRAEIMARHALKR